MNVDFLLHPDTSENVSGEKKMNGHGTSPRDKVDENTKSDESEEENSLIPSGNGHEQDESTNLTNGKKNGGLTAAAAATSDEGDKAMATNNESDATSRRIFEYFHSSFFSKLRSRFSSSTNGRTYTQSSV